MKYNGNSILIPGCPEIMCNYSVFDSILATIELNPTEWESLCESNQADLSENSVWINKWKQNIELHTTHREHSTHQLLSQVHSKEEEVELEEMHKQRVEPENVVDMMAE